MLCSMCQANVDNNAQFCPYCGNKLSSSKDQSVFLTIGRNPENDIVINDSSVSRQHARVRSEQGCLTIEDMGSANGTYVNGYRIQLQRLAVSDAIRFGNTAQLSYRDIEAASKRKFGSDEYGGGQMYPKQPPQPVPNSVYHGEPIESHLIKSIISFVLFWPLGIAALINAFKVDNLVAARDYNQALLCSQKADKYAKLGITLGIIFISLGLLLNLLMCSASLML